MPYDRRNVLPPRKGIRVAPNFVWRHDHSKTAPRKIGHPPVDRDPARHQITPSFNRGLGLLNILKKCVFAVKAAPATGLEKFGEVFEPLFGEFAPARDNGATSGDVQLRCHAPARREMGRGRNRNESTHVMNIFCGKLKQSLANVTWMVGGGGPDHMNAKQKTRPGDQPDGSSHMARGWGARQIQPWGGMTAPHAHSVARGLPCVQKPLRIF